MSKDARHFVALPAPHDRHASLYPVLIVLIGTTLVLTLLAPNAWPVLMLDLMYPLLIVLAAAGWGAWPVRWLGYHAAPLAKQLCLAAAIGLGITAPLTLILGVLGLLTHASAWGMLIAGLLAGVSRLSVESRRGRPTKDVAPVNASARTRIIQGLVLLPLAVPLGVMLFGDVLPPGV
ncbi:MAG: hypothetical protein JXO22_05275, partial [Phycisphaerae bacterium]|nr:hypothetical protein [Phycisphaerae bacterium]